MEEFLAERASPRPDRVWPVGRYEVVASAIEGNGTTSAECQREIEVTPIVRQLWISVGFDGSSCSVLVSSFEEVGSDYSPAPTLEGS